MKATLGKYTLADRCEWCGTADGLREIKIQTNGVKTKRYSITATACAKCEHRLTVADTSDDPT